MRKALGLLARRIFGASMLSELRCTGCGQAFPAGLASRSSLCPECLAASVEPGGVPCPGCGEYPDTPHAQPLVCGRCQAQPRPWGRVLVYGPYEGPLRDLLLGYKFEHRLDFGRRLQEFALAAFERGVMAFPELAGCEVIVPVPLHTRRLLSRGFNQSREIARLLSVRRGLPIWQGALTRVRRTVPQMQLERSARAENIRGAFEAKGQLLAGRSVLLVDDIMTTGATLEECTRALLNAGAARVHVLVLARA